MALGRNILGGKRVEESGDEGPASFFFPYTHIRTFVEVGGRNYVKGY